MRTKQGRAAVTAIRQTTQYNCCACSLAMALRANGVNAAECTTDQVNLVMGAKPMKGATWEQIIAAAQHFGMRASLIVPSTVNQLKAWTDRGIPVIIAWNPEGREWSHASVVVDVSNGMVEVADPNIPDPDATTRILSVEDFYRRWFEAWPNYLVRRPACAIEREVDPLGKPAPSVATR